MKAFITGISGFVGSYLAKLLIDKGYEVFGITYSKDIKYNNLKVFKCDLRDGESLKKILNDIKPDHIYHLAGITSIPQSLKNPEATYETNILGSMNLFEASRNIKTRILFVGSGDEYGLVDNKDIPINERVLLRPLNFYSVSKASADMMAFQYFKNYNMDIVRVRPFNHTGPGQRAEFVCSDFARQIAYIEKGIKEPVVYVGNLNIERDFSDVRDVVEGYLLALTMGDAGEIYNICSGRGIKIKDILEILINFSNTRIKIKEDKEKFRQSETPIIIGNPDKFMNKTGWEIKIPIHNTLKDLLYYWRDFI
jgi:GDP-4-dehydro-6-deoxy-D-mannose reductase